MLKASLQREYRFEIIEVKQGDLLVLKSRYRLQQEQLGPRLASELHNQHRWCVLNPELVAIQDITKILQRPKANMDLNPKATH